MSRLMFSLMVLAMLAWTCAAGWEMWHIAAATPLVSAEMTLAAGVESLLLPRLLMWCLPMLVFGVIALITAPRPVPVRLDDL